MSKLWGWLAAIGLAMVVVMQRLAGQKEEAERTAAKARRRADTVERQRDTSQQAQEAANEAAQQAQETQDNDDARDSDKRPSGSFRTK